MRFIAYVLIAIIAFVLFNIEIDSNSPCSQFSKIPSQCNSDMKESIK